MKCPICDNQMESTVCACGYDLSRDYERYPTFGLLSGAVESAAGLRQKQQDLVRCAGCGGYSFQLSRTAGKLACTRCGQALTEAELKPLIDALGMKKETDQKKRLIDVLTDPKVVEQIAGRAAKSEPEAEPAQADAKRIVAIAAGCRHTVALYGDGTVQAIGDRDRGACDVSDWTDIVAIAAGYRHTTGLKKDGTVVAVGFSYDKRNDVAQWRDVVAVADGTWHTVGLKRDGTVVASGDRSKGRCDVEGWRDIQAIAAGETFTLGLDKHGKVWTAGKGKATKLPFSGWKNVKAIAAGYAHSAALTEEGMVLIAGDGGKTVELGAENADVDAGFGVTLVRKHNGSAAVTGMGFIDRETVSKWNGLTAIAVGRYHAVGLKADGTLVATGDNDEGQCDVQKLMRK